MKQHALVSLSAQASPLTFRDGKHASVDELWQLLLDTGFLYPEKLASMQVSAVRATLATLLAEPGGVFETRLAARAGRLEGHVSCARIYARTWLCQHLAARAGGKGAVTTGKVLSVAMLDALVTRADVEFVQIQYRPENAWPEREFGGCARKLNGDPLALFRTYAYVVSSTLASVESEADKRLTLRGAMPADRARIEAYFAASPEALLLRSHDLHARQLELSHVHAAYARLGLCRWREAIVAERGGGFAGFALLELSSPGINFSEFTNCFRVYAAPGDHETLAALARAARARYRALGYARCVALAEDAELGALQAAGFTRTKRYSCFTLHISRIGELRGHLLRARARETLP